MQIHDSSREMVCGPRPRRKEGVMDEIYEEEEKSYPWETEGELPWLNSGEAEPWAAEIDEPWLEEEAEEEPVWEEESPGWPEEMAGPEYWLYKDELE